MSKTARGYSESPPAMPASMLVHFPQRKLSHDFCGFSDPILRKGDLSNSRPTFHISVQNVKILLF